LHMSNVIYHIIILSLSHYIDINLGLNIIKRKTINCELTKSCQYSKIGLQ
jgi:hypothetical protein